MKTQIRRGVFETNSSSVHSLTMVSKDEFDRWKNGELYYYTENDELLSLDEIKDIVNSQREYYKNNNWDFNEDEYDVNSESRYKLFLTYDEFNDWDFIEYETFNQEYTSKSGDTIVAFGYYGHD